MMKIMVILMMPILFSGQLLANSERLSLAISFTKFKQQEGNLHYQVLDCNDSGGSWGTLAVITTQQLPVSAAAHDVTVENLPAGKYCVRFFQDLNANGELDLAANSVPREPVGFSNNPSLMMGQPEPEDCVFQLTQDETIRVKVNNKRRR